MGHLAVFDFNAEGLFTTEIQAREMAQLGLKLGPNQAHLQPALLEVQTGGLKRACAPRWLDLGSFSRVQKPTEKAKNVVLGASQLVTDGSLGGL